MMPDVYVIQERAMPLENAQQADRLRSSPCPPGLPKKKRRDSLPALPFLINLHAPAFKSGADAPADASR
jgi:hypothetical protein